METTVVSSSSSSTFHVVDSSSIELLGDVVVESHTPMEVDESETIVEEVPSMINSTTEVTDAPLITPTQDVVIASYDASNVETSSITTAPTTNIINLPTTSKDDGSKMMKPIYLIPKSGGGLTLGGTSVTGASTVNKVVLASNSSTLGGKQLFVTKSINDGKGIPIVMKGQYIGNTAVSGSTTGGHIITKVILTSQALTGQSTSQTVSLASVNSLGASVPVSASAGNLFSTVGQPVKIVAASTSQTKTAVVASTTVSSPAKTQIVTTVPASPSKQAIMVSKIALSPKAPTKIMIPVNVGKSPQKIAPAPSGTSTAQVLPKAMLSTVIAGGGNVVTGSGTQKLNTIMGSPTKVIIKPSTANLDSKKTVLSSSTSTAIKQVVASSGGTIGVQPIQVPGSKLSYIRLVTAPPSSTAVTGIKNESTLSVRSIAPAASTTAVSSSQVKLALPLTSTTGIVNRPIVASKSVTGQRIIIPASSLSNVTQIRPSAGSITVPASALAQLPPGTTLYSSGGNLSNIVMLPAQYVTQLQSQTTQPQTIVAAATGTVTTAARAPVVIAPSIQTQVDGISTLNQTYATPVTITSASSLDKSHNHSSRNSLNGKSTPVETNGLRLRKPCNCTKSQCLKLYCDCFANGEFCHNCNCNNCSNNLEFEEERQKAIKSCLERNPQAFHPKIVFPQVARLEGKIKGETDVERRHNKGCNCKRSGCLKNYCECYEAKIMCSYLCKCVGCKNFAESAEKKSLMQLAEVADIQQQRQTAAKNKLSSQVLDVTSKPTFGQASGDRLPSSFITTEVVEATCQCLLAQAEEGKANHLPENVIEKLIIQEFGRCLFQVIDCANKTKH